MRGFDWGCPEVDGNEVHWLTWATEEVGGGVWGLATFWAGVYYLLVYY